MKTTKIYLYQLRNEEHFQFGRDVIALVNITGVEPKVSAFVDAFAAILRQEDEAIEQIRKSQFTDEIAAADRSRDRIFYGITEQVRSLSRHFNPAISEAATRLANFPMLTYGPVAKKNYATQSAKIYNLLQELRDNYTEECVTLALVPWLDELERINNTVDDLIIQRVGETASRTKLVMKEVRPRADEAYRALVEAVEALYVVAKMNLGGDGVGSPDLYEGFIARLNAMIERYINTMSVRRGNAKAEKKKKEKKAAEEAEAAIEN